MAAANRVGWLPLENSKRVGKRTVEKAVLRCQERLVVDMRSAREESIEALIGVVEGVFEAVASRNASLSVQFLHSRMGHTGGQARPSDCDVDLSDMVANEGECESPCEEPRRERAIQERLFGGVTRDLTPPCKVAVAGTFDRLHHGHRMLLCAAAMTAGQGGQVWASVVPDRMLGKKRQAELIQPYHHRRRGVEDFLHWAAPGVEVFTGELQSPVKGVAGQPEVDALIVSEETAVTGYKVNAAKAVGRALAMLLPPIKSWLCRILEGLSPIAVLPVRSIADENGDKLSSSALRARELPGANAYS